MISLRRPIVLTNEKNYFRVRVTNAIIPHTIKQVNSSNNVLSFQHTKGAVITNGSITIPSGNYNILTLLTALTTALQAVGVLSTFTFTFTYDRNTSLCSFKMYSTDVTTSTLLLKFGSNTKLGLMFGVTADMTLSTTGIIVVGSQHVNVNPITYLTIRSGTLKQRLDYENIVERDVYSDVLQVCPINVSPGSFIICANSTNTDIVNRIIDHLNIYLADNSTYSISLNNLEWSLTLIFEERGIDESNTLLDISNKTADTSQLEQQRDQHIQELMMMKQQMINQLEPVMDPSDLPDMSLPQL